MSEQSEFIQQILTSRSRDLRLMAAQGMVPLIPGDLVPLQVQLASSDEEEVAEAAVQALGALEPGEIANLIDDGAPTEVLSYFSRQRRHALVLEAILRRKDLDSRLLVELAAVLGPEQQEILLLRQDAIVEEPAILEALEENPEVSSYSRRRIREYREHLLPKQKPIKSSEELEREADELTEQQVDAAFAEAGRGEAGPGEVEKETGLSENQIRSLPVPVRLKLSRGAAPSLRNLLVRDPNPMVATSVLRNNPMSDSDIERIAASRQVVPEVLEAIHRNRHWMRKYAVILSLVRNPRTPAGIAIRLLSRISVRDLALLRRDRNVANAVRSTAARLAKIKRA